MNVVESLSIATQMKKSAAKSGVLMKPSQKGEGIGKWLGLYVTSPNDLFKHVIHGSYARVTQFYYDFMLQKDNFFMIFSMILCLFYVTEKYLIVHTHCDGKIQKNNQSHFLSHNVKRKKIFL